MKLSFRELQVRAKLVLIELLNLYWIGVSILTSVCGLLGLLSASGAKEALYFCTVWQGLCLLMSIAQRHDINESKRLLSDE